MPHKTWDELSSSEKERVKLIILSLKEFSYGVDRTAEVAEQVKPGAAKLNFYMSALYQLFANYFLVGGPNKLSNTLKTLGCEDLMEPIQELLQIEMGNTTVCEIMRTWRDKGLVHQTFTFKPIHKGVYSKVDLVDPGQGELYSSIVTELFLRTKKLYVAFTYRYADAVIYH